MRKSMFFLVFALITGVSFGQDVSLGELLGVWKVEKVSMESGKIHFDFEKDSLHIAEEIKKSWTSVEDSTMAMAGIMFLKEAVKELEMIFLEKGIMQEKNPRKTREGTYTYDESTGILVTVVKGEQKLKVKKENNFLILEPEIDDGPAMVLHLKKQK